MNKDSVKLTVFFDAPFWVGVFERTSGGRLSACKVTFGAEPRDDEVYAFILAHYGELTFSPSVAASEKELSGNPKRLQRLVRRQVEASGIGTKSQQALKLQQEQRKDERRALSREMRDAAKERQFAQKQQKRKEKHKGR